MSGDNLIPMPPMKEKDEPDEKQTASITTATPIQLGLLVVLISGIATFAWKISAISAKLDNIAAIMTTVANDGADLKRDLADHKRNDAEKWTALQSELNVIKQSGSPRLQEFEKRMIELEVKFSIHEASCTLKKTP